MFKLNDNFILKLKSIAEIIIAIGLFFIGSNPFPSLFFNIIIFIIGVSVFMDALGNIDDINGYGKNNSINNKNNHLPNNKMNTYNNHNNYHRNPYDNYQQNDYDNIDEDYDSFNDYQQSDFNNDNDYLNDDENINQEMDA